MISFDKIIYVLSFITILYGCNTDKNNKASQKILTTDSLFSKYSVKHGLHKAFIKYADTNAVLLRDNRFPIKGKSVIKKYFQTHKHSQYHLRWSPIFGEVAKSEDIAYTYGIYTLTLDSNETFTSKGTYISIWKKQKDGSWKWVLDAGTKGLPSNKEYTEL